MCKFHPYQFLSEDTFYQGVAYRIGPHSYLSKQAGRVCEAKVPASPPPGMNLLMIGLAAHQMTLPWEGISEVTYGGKMVWL